MQKILVIAGCTAVGKSAFALDLSKFLNMEIISADSVQVYKGVNVATSKPNKQELEQCKHYMIDFVSPFENFNAYDFVNLAEKYISEIASKKCLPVIVGGTGLYIDSLINGFDFESEAKIKKFDVKYIFLNDDRQVIYDKINKRVDLWIADGLVDEVKKLREIGVNKDCQCMQAIGYKEVWDYLDGCLELNEAVNLMKKNTRNYAKRQLTWFNHRDCERLDINNKEKIIQDLVKFYSEYKK